MGIATDTYPDKLNFKVITKLPTNLIIGLVIICLLPMVLTLFGVSFATQAEPLNYSLAAQLSQSKAIDAQFYSLGGAVVHTLMEWTAFLIAIFVVFLSFSHYKITNDVITPIIGMAFFMSGCMDAFHTLAADRLIEAVAPNTDLIPFTWAISRVFNVLIMIAGVMILLNKPKANSSNNFKFVVITSIIFGVIAYLIIHFSATAEVLPKTTFPDALITRPYDAIPLVLFIIAGIIVYPLFYKRYPSLFAHALVYSALPEVVTQLHMSFGSTALYDNHFNIAHFLKIIAYAVPLIGLSLDYTNAYAKLQHESDARKKVSNDLLRSELFQRSIIENMLDGLITVDAKGTVISFNVAASTIFGFSEQEIVGENISKLLVTMTEDDDLIKSYIIDGKKDQGASFRNTGQRKNEEKFPFLIKINQMKLADDITYCCVIHDLTDEDLNRQQLIQAAKLASIGTLTAGIAHELRQPLFVMRGHADEEIADGVTGLNSESAFQTLNKVVDNCDRMDRIINHLRCFSREQNTDEMDLIRLDKVIEDSFVLLKQQYNNKGITVQKSIATDLSYIFGNSNSLQQVFINLFTNAMDAMEQQAKPELNIKVLVEDKNIVCRVSNNGDVIADNIRNKIFDPFFTTKDTNKGTGLGLSISYGILTEHKGTIHLSNTCKIKDTEFVIKLPICDELEG